MTDKAHFFEDIKRLVHGRCYRNIPLRRFTSFRIGGSADIFVEPENPNQLAGLLRYLSEEGVPRIILGAGTNVLFPDSGFRGVVIRTSALKTLDIKVNASGNARITAGPGVSLLGLIGRTCCRELTGLEPLWGIPGSIGGAVAVNAGSGGVCVGDVLDQLKLLTCSGEELWLKKTDLNYGYRQMNLPKDSVIVAATVLASRGDRKKIKDNLRESLIRRRREQPWKQSSAGCVFKNPSPEKPAGAIIDRLGFKGVSFGGAQVSNVHANFIINRSNATASDVLELVERIRGRVREEENIELELEIQVIVQGPTDD